jgi:hypothetical protein
MDACRRTRVNNDSTQTADPDRVAKILDFAS